MTSSSIFIHLGDKTTIRGKSCLLGDSCSFGLILQDSGKASDDVTIFGSFDQLQAIVDELGAALDKARAEWDAVQELAEAKEAEECAQNIS